MIGAHATACPTAVDPFLSEKYNIPPEKWTVQGLLFGSRGSLPKFIYLMTGILVIFPLTHKNDKKENQL